MRTLGWLIALLVNFGVIAAFAPRMFYGDVVGFVVSTLFAAICALLVVARVQHLPSWAHTAMKLLCWAVPVLWLAGSLDKGMISGQEMYSIIFAVFLGWGSWRAFLLYSPRSTLRISGTRPEAGEPLNFRLSVMKADRVLTINDYYDGPRLGIAELDGIPHIYEAEFDQSSDEYGDRYFLSLIDQELLAAVMEDWAIWCRWDEAHKRGEAVSETHPALPYERSRHAELKQLIWG